MNIFFAIFITITQQISPVPLMKGENGFYSSSGFFNKPGSVKLILRESYGIGNDTLKSGNVYQVTTNFGLFYTPFTFLELAGGYRYLTQDTERSGGFFTKAKLPILTMEKLKLSISPCFTHLTAGKSYYTTNIDLGILPLLQKDLPEFLFSQSINIGNRSGKRLLQLASNLSLYSKYFTPFIEFYTEFSGSFSLSERNNSQFLTGLRHHIGGFNLTGGIGIGLDEIDVRVIDYNFILGLSYSCNIRKKSTGTLLLTILDKQSKTPISATVSIRGANVKKSIGCNDGTCKIKDIPYGFYTLEVKKAEYRTFRVPIFIKTKKIEKIIKLKKIENRKGGDNK